MKNELKISPNLEKTLKKNTGNAFFKSAGNIDNNISNETNEEFLFRITSGISYKNKEDYIVLSGGKIITTIEEVKKMVNNGYNIIHSSIIGKVNENTLVEVEFEKLMHKENKNAFKK